MLTRSATSEPLAQYDHERISPSSSDDKCTNHLRPLPFPVISRTSSRGSSASYCSTTALNPVREPRKQRQSIVQKLLSRWRHCRGKDVDLDAQHLGQPSDKEGGTNAPRLRAWHGWRLIVFDSWLNLLILLIPIAGMLKLTLENSETLVFAACLLAMIPLVKLHDLATGVLSRRIGGNKTGLLNSSMSNMIEMVVAIIALRKCELRVVQSSLIGAMLSKLRTYEHTEEHVFECTGGSSFAAVLILGMCFFAGGMRFSEQGFDTTATQIHSSLLSISVGAVLLPAAFHFSLTYNTEDSAEEAGTTLQDQKEDILRMSHGVAIVLLFIYASYLLFQLWSHTHLYKDSTQPSNKLPVAESVRTVTSRVRKKSNTIREQLINSHPLQRVRTGSERSFQTLRTFTYPKLSLTAKSTEKIETLEEAPETSLDEDEAHGTVRIGPYMQTAEVCAGRRAMLMSPFSAASQVTLANPISQPAESTVRLVSEKERFVIRRESSCSDSDSRSRSRSRTRTSCSGSGEDSTLEPEEDQHWRHREERGRSRTPVSEVLSAYYQDRGTVIDHQGQWTTRGMVDVDVAEPPGPSGYQEGRDASMQSVHSRSTSPQPEQEMSWTLIILLLLSVAALVAVNAEWLVDTMDNLSPTISKEWIGLILLPTVSSIAECVTAINVSVKDQLTLSISVAVGSTIQTALFVIPSMVVLGWILDKPLALLFDPFESVVLYISVQTMGYVVADGKSNWLEGVILVCLYVVIAVTFWFYPGSNFSSNLAVCTESPPIAL
ncbi:Sodium/calcium exchanger protein-domain-containing protein [Trametes punicea]|nr:Sodium/calcium exchanger protein-domain-containing protein [Trametes punicea]